MTLKSLFRLPGNKSINKELLNRLKEIYNYYSDYVYCEPFAGALGSALAVNSEVAVLNDSNDAIYAFYQWIKYSGHISDPDWFAVETTKELYEERRKLFRSELSEFSSEGGSVQYLAKLFWWISQVCYNGVYRESVKSGFNVPMGRDGKKIPKQFKLVDLEPYKNKFQSWRFSNVDFEDLHIKNNFFLYVDPPYWNTFSKYSQTDFKWKDQVRLVDWLCKLDNPIVLSNSAEDDILNLYIEKGFEIEIIKCPRKISKKGDRPYVNEVIATKNLNRVLKSA